MRNKRHPMTQPGKFFAHVFNTSCAVFIATSLSFSGYCLADEQAVNSGGVTVKEVALQAIEANPDVQASWHTFKASTQDIKVARSGYLPSVDLSASGGRAQRDYDGRDDYTTTQGEISLTQMLFDGFKTSGQVDYFKNSNLVRYYELMSQVETTALEAVKSFEDVKRTRELVELARANYAKHREVYAQIQDRTQSGVGRRVDLEQVAGRLALAESNLLTEAANLHDVTAHYLRVVGQLPPDNLLESHLADTNLPADIREMLLLAYQGNPAFHAAIKNISAAESKVKSERSGYYPKVELRARQVTNRNLDGFDERVDPKRFGDESAIELGLTYNLYAGGASRASVRRAYEDVNLAKDQRDQACMDLRQDTQIAYNDSKRIREQLMSLEQHKLSSDKVRNAYYEQFNIGQRTLLDLLDAENEYFQASRSLTIAKGDLEIAYARSLSAMGKLLVTLGITRDGLAVFKDIKIDDQLNINSSACPDMAPVELGRDQLITEVNNVSGDALFDLNSSKLKPEAQLKLNDLIARIKTTEKVVQIDIAGHTDNTGNDLLNANLSRARAQAVRDYFVLNGLQDIPMSVQGLGASKPIADNTTDAGRAANRRVEISVSRTR